MPNQLNFPDELPSTLVNVRPERLDSTETNFFKIGTKQVIFGESSNDVVEVWVYFADGRVAGQITLNVLDPAIKISTVVDNTGAYEFVNLDFGNITRRLALEQGRYAIVLNIFRNEIGSSTGNKLYIDEISSDRTELRLVANVADNNLLRDIYEFITPSVPKIAAQGLVEQTFGKNIDVIESEKVTPDKVKDNLDLLIEDTSSRVNYSESNVSIDQIINTIVDRSYKATLDNMAADVQNKNIQAYDLELYIIAAVQKTILEMNQRNEIDNRFEAY